MSKRASCRACINQQYGVKTRVAVPHTCGMKHLQIYEKFTPKSLTPVVYHGTTSQFDNFYMGKKSAHPTYGGVSDIGLGIFFTDNKTMASWFAGMVEYDPEFDKYVKFINSKGRLVKARLEIKNPMVFDNASGEFEDSAEEYFDAIKKAGNVHKFKHNLVYDGYDGVIVKDATMNYYADGGYTIYVVFDPKQIHKV